MKWFALLLLPVAGLLAGACLFGGDDDDPPPPSPTVPTSELSPSPVPSPTPNRLATPPADQSEARAWLEFALGPSNFDRPCPQSLVQYGVICADGDVDGGGPDFAYLVPVKLRTSLAPHPAAVFVRRNNAPKLDELALGSAADASAIGANVFGLNDRTGDERGDLTYLQNVCSATGCKTLPVIFTWDGNAWRDVGPGGDPIGNVDSAKWEGSGSASKLVVHGGKLPADAPKEAGPTRATTRTFAFSGLRYILESETPDPPEYLYHAILDAERVFQTDKAASIEAFTDVVEDAGLLDWRPPAAPDKDRRPALIGFALFRIALAHAATQSEPATLTAALDSVVNHGIESGEPLFVRVTEEFRLGYASNGLASGCAAVLAFIDKQVPGTNTRAYIAEAFKYGYENPPGDTWIAKICPF